jgi:hypothetical protein
VLPEIIKAVKGKRRSGSTAATCAAATW